MGAGGRMLLDVVCVPQGFISINLVVSEEVIRKEKLNLCCLEVGPWGLIRV